MVPANWSSAFANHLWQSTLWALTAGLLTLILRKNQARVRYWLWLTASLKFLIPFSWLVSIGTHLAWTPGPPPTKGGLYLAMEQVSQPFSHRVVPVSVRVPTSTVSPTAIHLLPCLLLAAWLAGCVVVLWVWYRRWRRIFSAIEKAVPVDEGREVEALRGVERLAGVRQPIGVFLSSVSLEPGIFGIARPILLWPKGISKHLEDRHLEAILVHEVCHVRRRDNLTAAMHMLVEALFWFHPLVWWLGARLVDERERACDEEVLQLGSEREIYAESILKTCEFCVGSPLACVSGVTGADLKKRMVQIMTERVAHKVDVARKLLLSGTLFVAVALPIVSGLVSAKPTPAESHAETTSAGRFTYEVASIKPYKSGDNFMRMMFTPDGLTASGSTLQALIDSAYEVEDHRVFGAPSWLRSEKYDVEAKMDGSVADQLRKLDPDQRLLARRQMLQALLADRFKLIVRHETRELPVYLLVVGKNGPKIQQAKPGNTYPNGFKDPAGHSAAGMMFAGGNSLTAQGVPIANLVRHLSFQLGRTVIDKTGLTGNYDFTLNWSPDQGAPMRKDASGGEPPADTAQPDTSGASIFTTLQEQLGLKLESAKGPVEVLIIEHVEKPSEN